MFEPKFKIGDKVYAVPNVCENEFSHTIGTICDISYGPYASNHYRVEYDGTRLWVCDDSIKLVNENEKENNEMKSYSVSYSFESDGKKTTGKKYVDGKLVAEKECTCHPDDKFDFNTGMNIVKNRLDEYHKSNTAVKHLMCGDLDYGIVGDETNMVDKYGRKLFVGDVVNIKDDGGITSKAFVCREDGYMYNAAFIMGIAEGYNDNHMAGRWHIELLKPFNIVSNESFDGIKVVKK